MKNNIYTLALAFLFSLTAMAQQVAYTNWAIGNGGGLSFQNGNVVQFQSQMACQDMGSTVSDAFGNVLFYCNGTTVYNKNNNVMDNGTGLLGDITGGHAALILIQPETKFYYIFTLDKYADSDGLRYHIVDISANGGLGAVITKNVVLLNPASEKIAAVWNSNQNCFKIITHKFGNNEFRVFELNNSGLNTTPVISAVGPAHQNGSYGQAHDALGQMSISPDGSKVALALCYSQLYEIYDFNINTGELSNPVSFGGFPWAWGIDFSPNSKFVYFTQWTKHKVYQADISSGNSDTILASVVELGTITGAGQYSVGYVSKTPDNRIFIAKYGYDNLVTIEHPDSAGIACGFNEAGITLQYGSSTAGLSCAPVFPANLNSINDIERNAISLFPNPNAGTFTIVKNKLGAQCHMQLFTLDGSLIFSKKLHDNLAQETFNLELESGVYFVYVDDNKGSRITQKMIVAK